MYSSFLHLIDIFGTFAFAVSGAFSAMERKLDPFGVLIIAYVTALGGGTLRDVLVGNLPVNWLTSGTTIIVIFSAAIVTMLFGSRLHKLDTALFLFDALGLGLFTIIGLEIGLRYGFSAGICVALGTITACFGGVLRDVMLNKLPLIFHQEIYALACITGGAIYYGLTRSPINDDVSKVIAISIIFVIRVVAVRYKLSLPPITLKENP